MKLTIDVDVITEEQKQKLFQMALEADRNWISEDRKSDAALATGDDEGFHRHYEEADRCFAYRNGVYNALRMIGLFHEYLQYKKDHK